MLNTRSHNTIKELKRRMRLKEYAEIKDRIFVIVLARKGETAAAIADRLGYHISWVMKWVSRYRKDGFNGLLDHTRPGQPKKLTEKQEAEFKLIVKAGPAKDSGLSRYRAKDLVVIIKNKFGIDFSISGVKILLHRLGFSSIKPRPKHPLNDKKKVKNGRKSCRK